MTATPAPTPPQAASPSQPERLALIGHDLRAALSDVVGGLRLIDPAGMDQIARLQLERVRSAGEVLARLIEETLVTLQEDGPALPAAPGNLQLARFLYDLDMRWSGRAQEKGLTFRLTFEGDVPLVVGIDSLAAERILSNLLSNAIKFTDRGSVTMLVGHDQGPSGPRLSVTIRDDGPGFSAQALDRLYEFRSRPAGASKPGHGLGLHITKALTDRLGGVITVENRPGGGAQVRLELPCALPVLDADPQADPLPDLSGLKVLVAEDNATCRLILTRMLSQLGAEFALAEDGVSALQWLERETFDLALIDIEMPHIPGTEVIRTLRCMAPPVCRLPVIAVTAHALPSQHAAILSSGADAILEKPVAGVAEFGLLVTRLLGPGPSVAPDAAPGGDTPADDAPTDAGLNLEAFDRLIAMAGSGATGELLARLDQDLRQTRDGLGTALADGDRIRIRADTHVLIALAGAVGAERLQACAQDMNAAMHQGGAIAPELEREAVLLLDRLIRFISARRNSLGEAG